jgi:hypothetical protein
VPHQLWSVLRRGSLVAAPLALAGLLAALGPAAAAPAPAAVSMPGAASAPVVPPSGCQTWTGGPPPIPGSVVSQLSGVTVLPPCSAWAVGFSAGRGPDQVLIEHWDGANWTTQRGQNPGRAGNRLLAVSAVSVSDVWAAGRTGDGGGDRGLIEHWNGTAWSVSPFTPPGRESVLRGVAAVSARDVWAVGEFSDAHGDRALIEHWDGTRWTQVPTPDPVAAGNASALFGVSATGRHEAWAVGRCGDGNNSRTLALHWNGVRWRLVPTPDPGTSNRLAAVTIIPDGGAWAVGQQSAGGTSQALILRWTGLRWLPVPSPDPGGPDGPAARGAPGGPARADELLSVTATSPFSAWAVGDGIRHTAGGAMDGTVILHWDGRSWEPVSSPQPGDGHDRMLAAVAASSARDVWAVGSFEDHRERRLLAIHCC